MGTLNLGNGASFTGGSNGFLSDAPKGQIIQIQHGILTTTASGAYDTSSPSVFKDTGLSVTITPTSTSSTILLQASFLYGGSRAQEQHYFRIVRHTWPYFIALMISWFIIAFWPTLTTALLFHEGAGIFQLYKP